MKVLAVLLSTIKFSKKFNTCDLLITFYCCIYFFCFFNITIYKTSTYPLSITNIVPILLLKLSIIKNVSYFFLSYVVSIFFHLLFTSFNIISSLLLDNISIVFHVVSL
ncbi:hypothetical protein EDEG_02006 [Edhazardia aedis USNM 41457]|uniref:Uncharacterized protein n=1 Tax=Edhazardia aedis (strain USNM 41457) TaxID=1003232 RepID=J9D7B6_EDHAE|nr:hypothetical protein EDEG_02006 [Edhazardia aedis USNM 41457]|eukprot:EJW03671.1 hypothetical protein EDEG_02006 [Edhazardia aedis USNM 41457]